MRVFGGERIGSLMNTLKIPEDQPIENRLISKAIESAQVKVEGFHFDARKRVVEYDDVANQQRDIIYKLRRRILEAADLKREIIEKLEHQVDKLMLIYPEKGKPNYDEIAIRAYGQRDPVVEFKNEAYTLFETLIDRVDEELGHRIFRIDVGRMPNEIPLAQAVTNADTSDNIGLVGATQKPTSTSVKIESKKIGRNDLCPCGSGKKYKGCGLLNTAEHQKLMGGR